MPTKKSVWNTTDLEWIFGTSWQSCHQVCQEAGAQVGDPPDCGWFCSPRPRPQARSSVIVTTHGWLLETAAVFCLQQNHLY
jgi:hypothetical protein